MTQINTVEYLTLTSFESDSKERDLIATFESNSHDIDKKIPKKKKKRISNGTHERANHIIGLDNLIKPDQSIEPASREFGTDLKIVAVQLVEATA